MSKRIPGIESVEFLGLLTCLALGLTTATTASAQFGAPDPRVEQRTYHFEDTDEELPYALFVSSKVSEAEAAPLIIALHGLGGDGNSLLRGAALDLAEQGGYILAGPIGCNEGGWYGSPLISFGGRGRGGQAPEPPPPSELDGKCNPGSGGGFGRGRGGANAGPRPPENLSELSEIDVMNVLAMLRDEFNVDDSRIYLMGHSMGGAGTYFLGQKHASIWAAAAAIAPAAFMLEQNRAEILTPFKEANVPLMTVQGAMDTAVPVANTREWIATMAELEMDYEYIEMGLGDHGNVITWGMDDIFAFFESYTKQ